MLTQIAEQLLFRGRKKYIKAACILTIFVFSTLLYLSILPNDFIEDDNQQIINNHWIRSFRNIPPVLFSSVGAFFDNEISSNYYRPVMYIVYMIDYAIFGLEPWGYHLTSIVINSLNCILVFLVALLLLEAPCATSARVGKAPVDTDPANSTRFVPALFSGLVFAVHPAHVESVAWAAAIPELTHTFFYLLSFYLYVRYATGGGMAYYALSIGTFFMAALSKEPGLTLPLTLLAYDLCIRKKPLRPLLPWVWRYAPYAVIGFVYIMLRAYALDGVTLHKEAQVEPYTYLFDTILVTLRYLENLLFPVELTLFEPKSVSYLLGAFIGVLSILWLCKRPPLMLFLIVFTFIPFWPVYYLGWMQGGVIYADRFLYLPSVGFSLFFSFLSIRPFDIASHLRTNRGGMVGKIVTACLFSIMTVVVILYSADTIERKRIWRSQYDHLKYSALKYPMNPQARFFYGIELSRRGMLDEALKEFNAVVEMEPDNAVAYNNIGIVYAKMGSMEKAVEAFKKAIELSPEYVEPRKNLEKALAIMEAGR